MPNALFFFISIGKLYRDAEVIPIYLTKMGLSNSTASMIPLSNFCKNSKFLNNNFTTPSSFPLKLLGYNFSSLVLPTRFNRPTQQTEFCHNIQLTTDLKNVIEKSGDIAFYLDDLVFWAPLGEINSSNYKIYTKFTIYIQYNDQYIIGAYAGSEDLQDISKAHLSYSVEYQETAISSKNRLLRSQELDFFEHPLHSKSLILSFLEFMILAGVIFFIIQIMLADSDRFLLHKSHGESLTDFDISERRTNEHLWKNLAGDVFRVPKRSSSLIILSTFGINNAIILILNGILDWYYNAQQTTGKILEIFLITNFISIIPTSCIAGLYSNIFIHSHWTKIIYSTFMINISAYIILSIVLKIPLLSSFITFPRYIYLSISFILCGIFMTNLIIKAKLMSKAPCEVALVPRRMPTLPWYLTDKVIIPFLGFVCSIPIYSELFFLMSALWFNKVYYVFNFFTCAIFLFLLISCGYTIIVVFFRLEHENHKWQWLAFIGPAFSSFFIFIYEMFFFFSKCDVSISFIKYFVVSLWIAIIIGSASGGISFLFSSLFIRAMYRHLKMD